MTYQHLHWAYELTALQGPAKPILVALADQADSDGECWPGQQRLAGMTGVSTKTVERACQRLERLGLISRTRRHTSDGYRTSDRFQLHIEVTHQQLNEALAAEAGDSTPAPAPSDLTDTPPSRQSAYKAEGLQGAQSGLPDRESEQRELRSLDPSGESPDTPVVPTPPTSKPKASAATSAPKARDPKPPRGGAELDPPDAPDGTRFADFWHVYPRRDDRRRAENAWRAARRRATPTAIIAGAQRYADDPNREQQFTKQPATWLNADAWANDPLPPRNTGSRENSIDRRNRQVAQMLAAASTEPTDPIGELTR